MTTYKIEVIDNAVEYNCNVFNENGDVRDEDGHTVDASFSKCYTDFQKFRAELSLLTRIGKKGKVVRAFVNDALTCEVKFFDTFAV